MATTRLPIADCLKYAELQMAAEASLVDENNGQIRDDPRQALIDGTLHGTRFAGVQATKFAEHWIALDQTVGPTTDFGGTLFMCIQDDPATGAEAGELVMSFRGAEFICDASRGKEATSEIKAIGCAWGRIRDMEAWYQSLKDRELLHPGQSFAITGCGLGGHLATVFNLLHGPKAPEADRAEICLVVTFRGAGACSFDESAWWDHQFDVIGHTSSLAVSTSKWRTGKEDSRDTRSLMSIVDSLNVQNTLLQMLPAGWRTSDEAVETLNGILRNASHLKMVDGDALLGGSQGNAEGDALESVLNALSDLALGPLGQLRLTGSRERSRWDRLDDPHGKAGRDTFYGVLQKIQSSDLYRKAVAGEVSLTLTASGGDLMANARTDFGTFAALYSLSPFVFSSSTPGSLEAVAGFHWSTIYDDWKVDKAALETGATTDELHITDRWLNDRAGLLEHRNRLDNVIDGDGGDPDEQDPLKTQHGELIRFDCME